MTDLDARVNWFVRRRRSRRHQQSLHLQKCGARPILEALLAVDRGQSVDAVLADFGRLEPETYQATLYYYAAMGDDADEVSS